METAWEYWIVSLNRKGLCDVEGDGEFSVSLNSLAQLSWEVDKVLAWDGAKGDVILRRPAPLPSGEVPVSVPDQNPFS